MGRSQVSEKPAWQAVWACRPMFDRGDHVLADAKARNRNVKSFS
jgi:hypothetical protein